MRAAVTAFIPKSRMREIRKYGSVGGRLRKESADPIPESYCGGRSAAPAAALWACSLLSQYAIPHRAARQERRVHDAGWLLRARLRAPDRLAFRPPRYGFW